MFLDAGAVKKDSVDKNCRMFLDAGAVSEK